MKELKLNIVRVSTEREKTACAEMMAGSEPWITLGISMEHIMNTSTTPCMRYMLPI